MFVLQADGDGEVGSLERMLTENLQKLEEKNDDRHLKKHEKYLELEQKIWDSRHPGITLKLELH